MHVQHANRRCHVSLCPCISCSWRTLNRGVSVVCAGHRQPPGGDGFHSVIDDLCSLRYVSYYGSEAGKEILRSFLVTMFVDQRALWTVHIEVVETGEAQHFSHGRLVVVYTPRERRFFIHVTKSAAQFNGWVNADVSSETWDGHTEQKNAEPNHEQTEL